MEINNKAFQALQLRKKIKASFEAIDKLPKALQKEGFLKWHPVLYKKAREAQALLFAEAKLNKAPARDIKKALEIWETGNEVLDSYYGGSAPDRFKK